MEAGDSASEQRRDLVVSGPGGESRWRDGDVGDAKPGG